MKNLLTFLLILISLFTGCTTSAEPFSPLSDDSNSSQNLRLDDSISDYWEYELTDDYIRIVKCLDFGLNITIPNEIEGKPVKVIGQDTFYQHKDTLSITIPESVTVIEGSSFYRCYSLEEVVIPKNVAEIGSNPFFRCSSLKNIFVDSENEYFADIDGVLFRKDYSEMITYPEGRQNDSYVIPEGVIKIADDAFGYICESLETLIIPDTVTEMPSYSLFAFSKSLTIKVKEGSIAEKYAKEYEAGSEQGSDNKTKITIKYY